MTSAEPSRHIGNSSGNGTTVPGDQKGSRVRRQQEAEVEGGSTHAGPEVLVGGGGAAAGCGVRAG